MTDLLFELGTEDLPATLVRSLGENLLNNITTKLQAAKLSHGKTHWFATPRRLAVLIEKLVEHQPDFTLERRGPAIRQAFDKDNKPTPAYLGFAKSCGVSVDALKVVMTPQGEYVLYQAIQPGQTTAKLLPDILAAAVRELSLPRAMRWGDREEAFVRPVHWIVALFGKKIIPLELFGVKAHHKTFGHRFLAPKSFALTSLKSYESALKKAYVMVNYHQRKQKIVALLHKAAKLKKAIPVVEPALLDEVTSLVEWPVALVAPIASHFLKVPREVLISAMEVHQRCFALENEQHELLPFFITISNIASETPKAVIVGNERVMRARLSDAEFFYQKDQNTPLIHHVDALKKVIFQEKLGTLYDKSQRLYVLSKQILSRFPTLSAHHLEKTCLLLKTDLMTNMVTEFPQLQGIMGEYYARLNQEPNDISIALREHYLPRFANDDLPTTALGALLAVLDRLDTIVGIFMIGQMPTGNKDPFGLRRNAIGIIRILVHEQWEFSLLTLIDAAYASYQNPGLNRDNLTDFFIERLRAWYVEQGISSEIFEAAKMVKHPLDNVWDFHCRVLAIQEFLNLPEAPSLIQAHKRVNNILKKIEVVSLIVEEQYLQHAAEKKLFKSLMKMKHELTKLDPQDYVEQLRLLANLQHPVDKFFEKVMVMDENEQLRMNRLALLFSLRELFLSRADIALLQAER